jgi:PAS domain S-box-containing protein
MQQQSQAQPNSPPGQTAAPASSTATLPPPPARRSRLLLRGESKIVWFGGALACIILVSMGASAWWAYYTQTGATEVAHAQNVHTVGDLLSQNVESLLTSGDVTAVRRAVAEASAAYHLSNCRVVLSNGQIIASSEPSHITAPKLPDSWRRTRLLDEPVPASSNTTKSYPIRVAGRGDATLELTAAPPARTAWNPMEAATGVGAISSASFVALLLTYRALRRRIRSAESIREALLAIGAGETSAPMLSVAESLGPEAKAWNALIAERDRFRKQGIAERARETLGARGQGKGDLSAACDAMSQGLVLVDEKHNVSYANGAAAVFLRCKREDLVGASIGRFLQVEPVMRSVNEIVSGAGRRRTVHDIERKPEGDEGTGVLRFSVRPVRRDDGASAMVTIEDITQQRVAEEARHSFVAQATHELRTPLTNIRIYVETAIDEGEQDPATRSRCLNVINGETRRLERIVGEMLSVAEIEAGSFKILSDDVRLETVFEDLQHDYSPQAKEKELELTFNLPPKLPQLKGDRDKIMLALHNLIGNALKYTPSGGKVAVNVTSTPKSLTVEVQDSGIGISEEDAAKLFQKFYRAKDPRVGKITGTGLGLALAREVVRLHGGDITVDSQLNQGSTFTISIPLVAEAAA